MTKLKEIDELIMKGNKERWMSRGDHYYLKAIAMSLREILKIQTTKGIIPNFIILDDSQIKSVDEHKERTSVES